MECKELKNVEHRTTHVPPRAHGCEECLKIHGEWVHLRVCLECGHVGCCDSSPHRHATAHFHETKHPVIKSFEPGEDWAWCYAHEQAVDSIRAFPDESPRHHYSPPQRGAER